MYVCRLLMWDFLFLHVLLMAETWYGSLTVKHLRKVAAWMEQYRIAAFFRCPETRLFAMSVFLVGRTYRWRKPFIEVNKFFKITLYIASVKCPLDVGYIRRHTFDHFAGISIIMSDRTHTDCKTFYESLKHVKNKHARPNTACRVVIKDNVGFDWWTIRMVAWRDGNEWDLTTHACQTVLDMYYVAVTS